MQKKIALVVDDFDKPFGYIAERIVHELGGQYIFQVISTESSERPIRALRQIGRFKPDIIHFFWRGSLEGALNIIRRDFRLAEVLSAFRDAKLSTSIPDFLFQDPYSVARYRRLFEILAGYVVVNSKLKEIYDNWIGYKSPYSVIHDMYLPREIEVDRTSQPIKLIWVGNSEWGKWAGYLDHKGFESIVQPLESLLKDKYHDRVHLQVVDSKVQRTQRAETLNRIKSSHIVLIASVSESTPLPLLEAMQMGCAVITTDVGIAREVLPVIQRQFIVSRSVESFFAAAVRLIEDRDLLANVQQQNRQTFQVIDRAGVGSSWDKFFKHILSETESDHLRKTFLFPAHVAQARRYKLFKKFTSKAIALKSCSNVAKRQKSDEVVSDALTSLELVCTEMIALRAKTGVLFLANPRWRGVHNSTIELADGMVASFPVLSYNGSLSEESIEKLASKVTELDFSSVVFSGGEEDHIRLAMAIRKSKRSVRLRLLWHGQSTQWVDSLERKLFFQWLELARDGTVAVIGTLKPSFETLLKKISVNSVLVSNFYRTWEQAETNVESRPNSLDRIGLWAASGDWRKNIFGQLAAMPLVSNDVQLVHTLGDEFLATLRYLGVNHVRLTSTPIARTALYQAMRNTELTSYVTLGECSPLTPLESMMNFSPAVVGPVSEIYHRDEVLYKHLVVEQPDSPGSIAAKIDDALANRHLILTRRDIFLADARLIGQRRLAGFLAV